jgi:hypothetical protein
MLIRDPEDSNKIEIKTKSSISDTTVSSYTISAVNNGVRSAPQTFSINTYHPTELRVVIDQQNSTIEADNTLANIDEYVTFKSYVKYPTYNPGTQ